MYTNTDTRWWYRRYPEADTGATACEYQSETTEPSSETKRSCARDAFVAASSSPKIEKSVTTGSIPPSAKSFNAVSSSFVRRFKSSHRRTPVPDSLSLQCFVANMEYTSISARNVAPASFGSTSRATCSRRIVSSSVCSATSSPAIAPNSASKI